MTCGLREVTDRSFMDRNSFGSEKFNNSDVPNTTEDEEQGLAHLFLAGVQP